MIGFVGSASQFRQNLIVDVVVIERVEALAIMCDAGIEGRIEPKQMVGARKDVTCKGERKNKSIQQNVSN